MFRRFLTRRRLARLAALSAALGLVAPHAWAWWRLREARGAVVRYHPGQARQSLDSCRKVWGWDHSPAVHLLACRAAWQDGDLDAAVGELRAAQRLEGGATERTAFEWALLQAAGGNVTEVDEYLQRKADRSPSADGQVVWEALASGYLRLYRTLDAMACLDHWLKRDPDNVRALELRGQTYVAGSGAARGAEDYRRVLRLDPSRSATRRRLVDALITLGGYEEAATHLERLAREDPSDVKLTAQLARCCAMTGRGAEASQLVSAALARQPDDPFCLRTRGQIELLAGRPAEAEAALRRSTALVPEDYPAQQLLHQSLLQQGKTAEARAQLAVAEAVRDRAARIGELTSRKLAEHPLDPALHYEMGKLLLDTRHPEAGERWLLNAVGLDPRHRPAHAALADYYEARGERAKAEHHRGKAAPPKE